MTTLTILRKRLEQAIADGGPSDQAYLEERQQKRESFIVNAYESGGAGFLERVRAFAYTEKGDKIALLPWYEDYCLLIGDLRLHHTITTGCSQVGKTLAHTFLIADALCSGKLSVAWFYDTRSNLDQNVPMQFRPVVEYWVSSMRREGYKFRRERDRRSNTRYQVDQANAIFAYTSTSRPGRRSDGGAAAGGAVVSFQADMLILEERSQYAPGSADPLPRRLDASMLKTKPVRELGTPGGGSGIEASMKGADRIFYPSFTCTGCGRTQPLDPKGCLLRKSEARDMLGRPKISYFSESGRPSSWWHSNPAEPVESAYLGCESCGDPIADEQRLNARLVCRETGQTAIDFIASLPLAPEDKVWKIGIHLTPLTRKQDGLAASIINTGLTASTTQDWQQQMLGHPSETDAAQVTLEMLNKAMTTPPPLGDPDFTVAGCDVGRAEDWLMIGQIYLPKGHVNMKPADIYEKAIRSIVFGSGIDRPRIPSLLKEYNVNFGLIDNEPSRESSMALCRETVLEMGDQASYLKDIVSSHEVADGGITEKCWRFRTEKFTESLMHGFLADAWDGQLVYRLPPGWEKWKGNPSERSPLVHLTGPYRDDEGRWHRPKGNIDDIFFALVFMEVALYLYLSKPRQSTSYKSGGSRRSQSMIRDYL